METALNEITLVLFTTIAPAGVVGYIVMALSIMTARDKERIDTTSHFLVVPLVLAISGLIASATHLGTPANALYVLAGIGHSPLSNEVVAAVGFLVLGGIYWIVSFRDDVGRGFRLCWLGATIVAGIVFVGFISVAYSVPSVPTWNLPTTPVTLWLNALVSGPLVGLFGLLLARKNPGRTSTIALLTVAALAAVANVCVLSLQWQALTGIVTTTTRAVDLVPSLFMVAATYLVFTGCAVAIDAIATLRRTLGRNDDPFVVARRTSSARAVLAGVGCILALTGCFAVRFAFYATHMTVGI